MTSISINGSTKLYGIIGNPVSHSFSPNMQTAAFQKSGLNAVYLPFPIQEAYLPHLMEAFANLDVKGFNVTVPYKEKIIPFLDGLSEEAARLNSVNTVLKTERGWEGFSTDGNGFVQSLTVADVKLTGKKLLLIGTGGAGRAIALTLAQYPIHCLNIVNRTVKRAETLKNDIAEYFPNVPVKLGFEKNEHFDILINSTTVGMHSQESPIGPEVVASCGLVVDIIYSPAQTPLLKMASNKGIRTLNGIGMLLYQGVLSFELWTGIKAPVKLMKKCLLNSLL